MPPAVDALLTRALGGPPVLDKSALELAGAPNKQPTSPKTPPGRKIRSKDGKEMQLMPADWNPANEQDPLLPTAEQMMGPLITARRSTKLMLGQDALPIR